MKKTAGEEPAAEASVDPGSDDTLLSPCAAARALGIPPSTVHYWADQDHVHVWPASTETQARYGENARLVRLADVAAHLNRRRNLLSAHEAAKITGVPATTINKWVKQEQIESFVPEPGTRSTCTFLVAVDEVRAVKIRRERQLSAGQAAKILGVTQTTAVWYCKQGYLPHERHGKLYAIDKRAVERFRELHAAGVPPHEIGQRLNPTGYERRRREAAARPRERRRRPRKKGEWVTCAYPDCPRAHEPFWRFDCELHDRNFHDECYDDWRRTYGWLGAKKLLIKGGLAPDRVRDLEGKWGKAKGSLPPAEGKAPRGPAPKLITPGQRARLQRMAADGASVRQIAHATGLERTHVWQLVTAERESDANSAAA